MKITHGPNFEQPSVADELETSVGSRRTTSGDSRSSQQDAGLDDAPWFEDNTSGPADQEDVPVAREVTMTDLEAGQPTHSRLHSAELSDSNAPGDIDIEDLDETDLDGTNLPLDARLDPLEP